MLAVVGTHRGTSVISSAKQNLHLVREGVKAGELDPKAVGLTEEQAAEALIAAACGAEKAPDEKSFRAQLAAIIRVTLRGLRA